MSKKLEFLRGPGVFPAQFQNAEDPRFNSMETCCRTFAAAGMNRMELPLWCGLLFDRKKALTSEGYVPDFMGKAKEWGVEVTQVSDHLLWNNVCPSDALKAHTCGLTGHTSQSTIEEMMHVSQQAVRDDIILTKKFGLKKVGGWSGPSGMTHISYGWPPLSPHVVFAANSFHAKQWLPLLCFADMYDVDICWELHPMHHVVSGAGFATYLPFVGFHKRLKELVDLTHKVLQGIRPHLMPAYIRRWGTNDQRPKDPVKNRIGLFHIKDAVQEEDPDMGTLDYGPFEGKSHRFRSLGRGCIPYLDVFAAINELGEPYDMVEEWEDCGDRLGHTVGKGQALKEGAQCITAWMNGEPTPVLGAVEEHTDGGFEAFATVNVENLVADVAAITSIPLHEVVLDPDLLAKQLAGAQAAAEKAAK